MELLGGNEDAEKHEYGDNDEFLDDHVYKGWPGDGSGEDDFADYNQMEGNDY